MTQKNWSIMENILASIDDIRPVFYKRVLQGIAAGTFVSAGYIIAAPIVFKLFLPKYLDSIRYSQVISLEFIFTTAASYVGSVFRSQKMIRTIYLSSVGANVIRIGFIVGLGAWLGIWGVIIATLGVHAVGTLFNFFLWHHELQHYQLG